MKVSKKIASRTLVVGAVMLSALAFTSAHAEEVRNSDGATQLKIRMDQKAMVRPGILNPATDTRENVKTGMNIEIKAIHNALELNDYAAFSTALTAAGITETISEANFKILVDALAKAKSGDISAAQTILKTNNIAPLMHRFIMANHIEITDTQKIALKEAADLAKDGKTLEARAVLQAAGLPDLPKVDPNPRPQELRIALDTAKNLRKEGKIDEAAQTLKDAGISERAIEKIENEFDKEKPAPKPTVFQKIKNFFKFGKK